MVSGVCSTTLLHALEGREGLSLDLERRCLCPSIPRHLEASCRHLHGHRGKAECSWILELLPTRRHM